MKFIIYNYTNYSLNIRTLIATSFSSQVVTFSWSLLLRLPVGLRISCSWWATASLDSQRPKHGVSPGRGGRDAMAVGLGIFLSCRVGQSRSISYDFRRGWELIDPMVNGLLCPWNKDFLLKVGWPLAHIITLQLRGLIDATVLKFSRIIGDLSPLTVIYQHLGDICAGVASRTLHWWWTSTKNRGR